jgi:type IV pilus assembly protein PilY1
MNTKLSLAFAMSLGAALLSSASYAQSVSTEDFTGATTANPWYYINGACLTASTTAGTGVPGTVAGTIPGCQAIASSYYKAQKDGDPVLVGGINGVSGGSTNTLPDPVGQGALRFTNGYPYGHNENGAIVSATPFNAGQGVQITFKTVTYRGDGLGTGNDGADGMSFYLIDATKFSPGAANWNGIGSWGGSLGYTCSNKNPPFDGLDGGYIGLGIDEFGNFLNGVNITPGAGATGLLVGTASGDNTAQGYGVFPQRIGLRGAGSVSWAYLNSTYPSFYTTTTLNTPTLQQNAVQNTCQTGMVWNYSASATAPTAVSNPSPPLYDYAPIPNAYSVLPAKTIAGEAANTSSPVWARPNTAIFYNLTITQDGLMNLSYALNGSSAYTSIIKNRSIAATNAVPALPASLYFGFAGSSGGDTNIHEIMCFKAAPATQSANSAAVSQQLATKIQGGAQIYFSYYNPTNWTGRLTANGLVDTAGVLTINSLANWDAQCVLTGLKGGTATCATTGVANIAAEAPTSRTILTWNGNDTVATPGTQGIPFEAGSLTTAQLNTLNAGDTPTPPAGTSNRLNYLRGVITNEIDLAGAGLYRERDGILGDIVDSSPAWVGPPTSPYAFTWKDRYDGGDVMSENLGQSYSAFRTLEQSRLNVVYVGANDGMLHGFESGGQDLSGNILNNATTPNDGLEVLAYMPGAVLDKIHQFSAVANTEATDAPLDYSNSLYAHNFFVDAPPGTGDLYYASAWHTWLVGGLGAGGSAIFALDVTNPSSSVSNPAATTFSESTTAAASLVVGEWGPATITCINFTNCGNSLGNTYGTPLIRRFHNGSWGVIFGNGFGSTTGDAGIYIMLVDPTNAGKSFYYLKANTGTGTVAAPCPTTTGCLDNGIAYVTSADLDGDHVTDYVYAGDLQGHVWRFDLTGCTPIASSATTGCTTGSPGWAVTPGPLFSAQSSTGAAQPITTPIVLASAVVQGTNPSLMLSFGTGQRTQFSNSTPLKYAAGTQTLYGVWDWNFASWNAQSAFDNATLKASVTSSANQTGLASPFTIKRANLVAQTFTAGATAGTIDDSNNTIPWRQCTGAAASTCNSGGKFGWYVDLPAASEQIVSTPIPFQQAVVVNSTIPANNAVLSCNANTDTGVTYVYSPITGGTFVGTSGVTTSAFVDNHNDTNMVGLGTNETGALTVVNTTEGTTWLVGQSITPPAAGQAPAQPIPIKLPPNVTVNRKTWVQLR